MRVLVHNLFFVLCFLALAACSPRNFHGEQVARTSVHDKDMDSVAFRTMIDRLVHEELQKQLAIREWMDQTIVKETFSAPDSAGVQHVTERTTTTQSKRKEASATVSKTKEEKILEQQDSTSVQLVQSDLEKEEVKTVGGEVKGWMPWYMYVAAMLVAVIIGAVIYMKFKGRII